MPYCANIARVGDGTRPVTRRHLGPLRVQKHLYAEGPEVCQHIIVHPPGGIAGGDRLDICAAVGEGAWAQLTSPGAAKWYRAASPAFQDLQLRVEAGATLEWLPQETILFDRASLTRRLEADLDKSSEFIAVEAVLMVYVFEYVKPPATIALVSACTSLGCEAIHAPLV